MAESVATESVATESVATASNAELAERADGEADQNEQVLRLQKDVAELKKELARRDDVDASPTKRDPNDADVSPTKRARTGMLSASSPTKQIRAETAISALATTFALAHFVLGKIVAAISMPVFIDWSGKRLFKYNFLLGAQTVLSRF